MKKFYRIDYDRDRDAPYADANGTYHFELDGHVGEAESCEAWLQDQGVLGRTPIGTLITVPFHMKCRCGGEFKKKGIVYGYPKDHYPNGHYFFLVVED